MTSQQALKGYQKIRSLRTDTSQYVMHCTRGRSDLVDGRYLHHPPFEVLKEILASGFLKATFAVVRSARGKAAKPTIRGPHPAACFTEQPLQFFLKSVSADVRYTKFGIAFRKDELFAYGGRPAIYDDESALGNRMNPNSVDPPWIYEGGLPSKQQYRWVGYDPTDDWNSSYAVDWTHEREWRVRSDPSFNIGGYTGLFDKNACIPLAMPTRRPSAADNLSRVIVLVDTVERGLQLQAWAGETASGLKRDGVPYLCTYAEMLGAAPIISFEMVEEMGWGRLEDVFGY